MTPEQRSLPVLQMAAILKAGFSGLLKFERAADLNGLEAVPKGVIWSVTGFQVSARTSAIAPADSSGDLLREGGASDVIKEGSAHG